MAASNLLINTCFRIMKNRRILAGIAFSFALSLNAWAQPQLIPTIPGSNQYPVTFTDPGQRQIDVSFLNPVSITNTNGWTITVNGVNATISTVIIGSGSNKLSFQITDNNTPATPGIEFSEKNGVVVTYTAAAGNLRDFALPNTPALSFTNPAVNNLPFDCDIFSGAQAIGVIGTPQTCIPISPNLWGEYGVKLSAKNSIHFDASKIVIFYEWHDATNAYAYVPTVETPAGSGVYKASANYTYPVGGDECTYTPTMYPVLLGTIPCAGGGRLQRQTFLSYSNDDDASGQLGMEPSIYNICIGSSANVIIDDATLLNCRLAVEPDQPHQKERRVRFIYGNSGTANRIPNISVGGVPVSDGNGNLIAGEYIDPRNSGQGIVMPEPVLGPTESTLPITFVSNGNEQVGDIFIITLEYWNPCNAYPFNSPVTETARLVIVDGPIAEAGTPFNICANGTAAMSGSILRTATSGLWWTKKGDGSFTNAALPSGAVYTPGPNDIIKGNVWLTLTALAPTAPQCVSHEDSVLVTIIPIITNNTVASAQLICSGSSPGGLTGFPPSGGNGTFTYQWQSSADNINFSNIGAATSQNYSPGALTTTTYYRRIVNSGPCTSISPAVQITIRPTPTVSITAGLPNPACQDGTSPNIVFSNPQSIAVTVTYNINGGADATVNVAANSSTNVSVSTVTAETFTYNLMSVSYQDNAPGCSNSLTGSVSVTVRPSPTASVSGTTEVCQGDASPVITFTNSLDLAVWIRYRINTGSRIGLTLPANTSVNVTASTVTAGTFVYSIFDARYLDGSPACINTPGGSATVTVRATPTATISGNTSACLGGTSPNIRFTNPRSLPVTVTYTINAGAPVTVNIAANAYTEVAVGTGTVGTFTYSLVSAVYQTSPTCSNMLTGSAVVTVRPIPAASISGTSEVCRNTASPDITFTNPQASPVTVAYNINGTGSYSVNVPANSSSTVAAPTGADGTFIYNLVSVRYQDNTPGCLNASTGLATVTVNPLPAPDISGINNVCVNATEDYEVPVISGHTYLWTTVLGTFVSGIDNTNPVTVRWPTEGSGSVRVTETITATGCSALSAVYPVTVNPGAPYDAPVLVTGATGFCPDGTLDIDVSDVATANQYVWDYSWVVGTEDLITAASEASISLSGLAPGTYWVTVSGRNGCGTGPQMNPVHTFTIYANPNADAGNNQYVCATNGTALAAIPDIGTGTWTQQSGPGTANFINSGSATTNITVNLYGTYTLRWTEVNGGICSDFDDVVITFAEAADAGPAQYICGTTSVTLAGNTPSAGTGTWTLTGTNAGTITGWGATNANTPAATPTVSAYGTYTFRWTITNGPQLTPGCSTYDDVVITFAEAAEAGPAQYICGTRIVTLAGNTPTAGTGTWTLTGTNPGTITGWGVTNANNPAATPTVNNYGTYTFRWTITNGPQPSPGCSTSDDVVITFAEAADAGPAQYICATTNVTLSGNTPSAGTGTWTLTGTNPGTITGWGATNANNPAATPTVNNYGTYTFRWTITNGPQPTPGCSTFDEVVISFAEAAEAGPAQYICATTNVTLAGNTPSAGTGTWTLTGTNPGTITGWGATNANNPDATPTVSAYGTYTFRWTITNGPQPTPGCSTSDDVVITFAEAADAGPAQFICGTTGVTLAGNTPTAGTGTWTLTGTNPGTITGWGATNANTPAATPTVNNYGTYTFRWTIVNGPIPGAGCQTFDDVVITFAETAAAGNNQDICGTLNATLAGNIPAAGTGTWTLTGTNPGTITGWGATNVNTPAATPTVSAYGSYTFRWTVVNGPLPAPGCSTYDDVVINFYEDPSADGGDDDEINVALTYTLAAVPYLYADPPNVNSGTYLWTLQSSSTGGTVADWGAGADTPNPLIRVNRYGDYVLRWTETNGTCSDYEEITLRFIEGANAGPDQSLCNVLTTILAGNTPSTGQGTWTQISGPGTIVFNDGVNNPGTRITADQYGSYVLQWEFNIGTAPYNQDQVQIDFYEMPTVNAGLNYSICYNDTIPLSGIIGGGATSGSWSLSPLSSSGAGSIENDPFTANPVTAIYLADPSDAGKTIIFRLTTNNAGPCPAVWDDVEVHLNPLPATSPIVGDPVLCANATGRVYQVSLPRSTGSTYSWTVPDSLSIESPLGQYFIFVDALGATLPGDKITVTETFTSTTGCVGPPVSFPIVVVEMIPGEVVDGPLVVCQGDTKVVYQVPDNPGSIYSWIVPPGASITSNPTLHRIEVTFNLAIEGEVSVIETSGTVCTTVHIPINVVVNPLPKVFNLTSPVAYCEGETGVPVTLSGSETGVNYQLFNSSGPVEIMAGTGAALVWADKPADTYNVIATNATTGCTLPMNGIASPVINIINGGTIGTEQTICEGSSPAPFTNIASATGAGFITYQWQSSSDNILFTDINGAASAIYGSGVLTTDTWYQRIETSTLGGIVCPDTSNIIMVTVNNFDPGSITGDQIICEGTVPSELTNLADPPSGDPGLITYRWMKSVDGVIFTPTGATGSTYTPPAPDQDMWYRLEVTSELNGTMCVKNTNMVTITLVSFSPGSIGSDQTICENTSPVPFTSVPAGGDGNKIYQWQYSDDNVTFTDVPSGGTGLNYTSGVLIADRWFRRLVTAEVNSFICTEISDTVHITVINFTPGNISADQTVCEGEVPDELNGTLPSGEGAFSYLWQSSANGTNFTGITGVTAQNYLPGAAAADTWFRRQVTAMINDRECIKYTDTVKVTVLNFSPGSISGAQTICEGETPSALNMAAPSGDGTITLLWYSSIDGDNFLPVSGETGASYSPGPLLQDTWYKVVVTSTDGINTCTDETNIIKITVNNFNPESIGSDQTICEGSPAAPLTSVTPSGDGAIGYSWLMSADGVTFYAMPGIISETYNPGTLSADRWYQREVSSLFSGKRCLDSTNIVRIQVNNLNPGSISGDQFICEGEIPSPPVSSPAISDGIVEYQWMMSTDGMTYTDILNETNESYSPPALYQDTWFLRSVTSSLDGICTRQTGAVKITVNNVSGGTIISDQALCSTTDPYPFISQVHGTGDGAVSWHWQSSTDGTNFTDIDVNGTGLNYDSPPTGQDTWFRRITRSFLNPLVCFDTSNVIVLTVNAVDPGIVSASQEICYGTTPDPFASDNDGSGSGIVTYKWYRSDNGVIWSSIPDADELTFTPGIHYSDTYYKRMLISNLNGVICTGETDVIKITVNRLPSGILTGGATICPGETAVLRVNMSSGAGPFKLNIENYGEVTDYISGTDISVNPAVTTTYSLLSVSDANGCEVFGMPNLIGTATVNVKDVPGVIPPPVSQDICEFGVTSFEVPVTGLGYDYQWYVDDGGGFEPVPEGGVYYGSLSAKLSIFGVTRNMNGNIYHVTVSSCSTTVTSGDATLTVGTVPEIVRQPADTTICSSAGAAFKVSARGTNITFQWQINTGSGFTDVENNSIFSGATDSILVLKDVPGDLNNSIYQVIIKGKCSIPISSNFALLRVNMPPSVSTHPKDQPVCDGSGPVYFFSNGYGVIDSVRWQVSTNGGDTWTDIHNNAIYSGTTTQQLSLIKVPKEYDGYLYRLALKAFCETVTSFPATLTVHSVPVVTFAEDPLKACGGEAETLVPVITGGLEPWVQSLWTGNVGPLNNYFTQTPTFKTVIAGSYELNYRVKDSNGCYGNSDLTVVVDSPDAAFTFEPTSGCTPLTVAFSKDMSGFAGWTWNFGDGTPENNTDDNPIHEFTNNTETSILYRTVTLTVRSTGGCTATRNAMVTVYPSIDATFTASDDTVCSGDRLFFSAYQGGKLYAWDFGDGGGSEGGYRTDHLFVNFGSEPLERTVTLTTTSFYDCIDSKTLKIIVMPVPSPQFSATPATQIFDPAGNTVTFKNETQYPETWTYLWEFGDGGTSTIENPIHIFSGIGTYKVVLNVTNGKCPGKITHEISIFPEPPDARFDSIPSGCAPLSVQMKNTSSNTEVPGTSYRWDFGDGSYSTAKNPAYTWFTPGSYRVELMVTGPGGPSYHDQIVTVHPSPKAYFEVTPPVVFANDERVRCFNLSEGADYFVWDFGDGDTSLVREPFHKYMEEGVYDITLWAYSYNGCNDMYILSPGVTVEPTGDIRFSTVFTPNKEGPIERSDLPTGGTEIDQFFFPPIREKVLNYKLQVFNRLGVLIFESRNINIPWNGYYKGQLCPQGVYVWYVEGKYANGQPFKKVGDITLLH